MDVPNLNTLPKLPEVQLRKFFPEIKLAQQLITSAQQYITSLQAPPPPSIPKPLPNPNNAITCDKCNQIFASTKERSHHVKNVHGK